MAESDLKSSFFPEADLCENTQLKNVIFSYEWNIGNFSAYLDRKYEIISPSFSFEPKSETKWKLVLFPKQSYPKGTELSVKLVKMSNDDKVHGVKYKVSVVSKQGLSNEMQWREKVFRNSYDFAEDTVISQSDLKIRKLMKKGTLTIRCEMDVIFTENENECKLEDSPSSNQSMNNINVNYFSSNISPELPIKNYAVNETKIKNYDSRFYNVEELNCSNIMLEKHSCIIGDDLSGLSDDLKGLYLSKSLADIIILSDGTHMYAHKAILSARSEYFKLLCSGRGLINNSIEIPDVKSAVMEAILYYLYTGKIRQLTSDFALDILSAAQKLCLYELQQIICNFIKTNITVENVTEILQLSDEQNLDDLKNVCIKFVNSHHATVFRSEKWQIMIRSNPHIAKLVSLSVPSFQNHNQL
ncbi:TD and POZ domain-containing protein 3 [Nephila pilipes]|uniref:TD and POZ domain-containing protein 3 n=1 Tax=Nephila pilipes TaxID=299642 RepID=A0A8X6TUC2_NEPPI|nr:TD and POZ domain-containing protein 3 [Nephila pilipes]